MRSPVNTWVCFKANWDVQTSPTFKMGVEYDQKIPKLTSLHFGERHGISGGCYSGFSLAHTALAPGSHVDYTATGLVRCVEKVNRQMTHL